MPLKKLLLIGFAAVCVFTFVLRHHFIHANGGLLVIQKSQPTLHDTYVDVRHWNGDEWEQHDVLTASVFASR